MRAETTDCDRCDVTVEFTRPFGDSPNASVQMPPNDAGRLEERVYYLCSTCRVELAEFIEGGDVEREGIEPRRAEEYAASMRRTADEMEKIADELEDGE